MKKIKKALLSLVALVVCASTIILPVNAANGTGGNYSSYSTYNSATFSVTYRGYAEFMLGDYISGTGTMQHYGTGGYTKSSQSISNHGDYVVISCFFNGNMDNYRAQKTVYAPY